VLALKKLQKEGYKFDIIFLDPPYNSDFDIKALNEIIELELLKDDGLIIIETDNKKKETEILKNEKIRICDIRQYGRVLLIFVRKE
jgi:16S rRNA G966 N2-methylase RsmD